MEKVIYEQKSGGGKKWHMSLQRKNTAIKGKSQNKGPHVGVYLFCLEMRKEFKVAETKWKGGDCNRWGQKG